MLRRVLDVAIAGSALVVTAPLLAGLAFAIRLDSPGPVIYRQTRIGRGKRRIQTMKLRTMVSDAETLGSQITSAGDPRVTRVGRWLRKSKLDELPQLWNIVRGDMSLVGPRPEVPRYVDLYSSEWQRLFEVRPGLTDLASVAFRNEERLLSAARDHDRAYREVIMPLKLELALEGVNRSTLGFDLAIVLRTALAVLCGPDPRTASVIAEAERRIDELNAAGET